MPFTDPLIGLVPRKMTDTELARAIRVNIAAEIDAINLYAAHMDATDNEAAKKMLAHIIEEEKEHLAEFLELLKILDPFQARELAEAGTKVEEIFAGTHHAQEGGGHERVETTAPPASPDTGTPTAAETGLPAAQTTVGSLRPGRQG